MKTQYAYASSVDDDDLDYARTYHRVQKKMSAVHFDVQIGIDSNTLIMVMVVLEKTIVMMTLTIMMRVMMMMKASLK